MKVVTVIAGRCSIEVNIGNIWGQINLGGCCRSNSGGCRIRIYIRRIYGQINPREGCNVDRWGVCNRGQHQLYIGAV